MLKENLDYISALRGFAIFGVLLVHGTIFIKVPEIMSLFLAEGQFGVQLFFVISAFTLFLSLSRRKDCEKRPVLNYFIRRYFRIAPLFYVAIAVYLFIRFIPSYSEYFGDDPISSLNIAAHILFINGFHPLWISNIVNVEWSIATEVAFYTMVPFCYKYLKTIKGCVLVAILLLIANNFSIYIIEYMDWSKYSFFYFWLPNHITVFVFGFILFHVLSKKESRSPLVPYFLLALVFCSIVILAFYDGILYRIVPKHILFGLLSLAFTYALSIKPARLFVNKFWIHLGNISFSVYLFHVSIYVTANHLMKDILVFNPILNYLILFSTTLAVSLIIGTATYKLIEVPAINLGKSLINKIESAVPISKHIQGKQIKTLP